MRNIRPCGKRMLVVACIVCAAVQAFAQQKLYHPAEKLPSGINSQAEEIMPLLAQGGDLLYFVRSFSNENIGGKKAGQDVWVSEKKEGVWLAAKNLKELNNGDNNSVVGFDAAHNSLYLINSYAGHHRRGQKGIVSFTKGDKNWGKPKELPVEIEIQNDFYGFYLAPDESTLIVSMMGEESLGEEDLYVSVNSEAGWSKPVHLGSMINSKGFEISPFLSCDKRKLYFSSNGFDGLGDADVYVSERLDDSWESWSTPVNMGAPINSEKFDAYFFQEENGDALFASNRDGGLSDLYQTTLIEEEEEESNESLVQEEEAVVKEGSNDKLETNEIVQAEGPTKDFETMTVPDKVTVFFGFDRFDLSSTMLEDINGISSALKANEKLIVKVVGYSDTQGPAAYNQILSEKRANAVALLLSDKLGIDKNRVRASGMGEVDAVDANRSLHEIKRSRKVEITFEPQAMN